jgi:hypothetical protein
VAAPFEVEVYFLNFVIHFPLALPDFLDLGPQRHGPTHELIYIDRPIRLRRRIEIIAIGLLFLNLSARLAMMMKRLAAPELPRT